MVVRYGVKSKCYALSSKEGCFVIYLLSSFHLNATIFHRSLLCSEWSTDTSGTGLASFHLISSGGAFLYCDTYRAEPLNEGDIVIFPHDAPHLISYHSDEKIAFSTKSFISYPMEMNIANSTGLICGYFDFDEDRTHPLIAQLPSCILVKKRSMNMTLNRIVDCLISEAQQGVEANEVVLARLSEIFFLTLLRNLLQDENTNLGLFKALQDPKMKKVLQALSCNISHPWNLSSLAGIGGYSRASFYFHFKKYLQQSPLEYLTHIRLSKAKKLLRQGELVSKVSIEIGYLNENSFAKAYKRHFGYGPGSSRKR